MSFLGELLIELTGEVVDALFGRRLDAWVTRQAAKIRRPWMKKLCKVLPVVIFVVLALVAVVCLYLGSAE